MTISNTNAAKKSAAQDILNSMGLGRDAAYFSVQDSTYSNKQDALDGINDLDNALAAARSAVNALS